MKKSKINNINFNNLPKEIKSMIFSINKHKDKHEKLFKNCIDELLMLNVLADCYNDHIKFSIGYNNWEHYYDYEYWISLEYNRNKLKSYFLKKRYIVEYIVNNYYY